MESNEQTHIEALNTLVVVLQGLYEQMRTERKIITMASGQMAHSAKEFENHLVQFETFEKACRQYVADGCKASLKQSMQLIASDIAQEVADVAYEPIQHNINSLTQLSQTITDHHQHQAKQTQQWKLWGVALIVTTALISGALGGWVAHQLALKTNKAMKSQLTAGDILLRSWSKLSQAEKDNIIKLSKET